jgi:hypothetical protein
VVDHGLMAFQDDRVQMMILDVLLDLCKVFPGRGIELPERLPQPLEFMALRCFCSLSSICCRVLDSWVSALWSGVGVGLACFAACAAAMVGCRIMSVKVTSTRVAVLRM